MNTMLFFSMLFPLLPLRWTPADPAASIAVLLEPVLITPAMLKHSIQENLRWIEIASVFYLTGVLIFLLRFGLQLIQLYRITRRFGISECHGQRVVFVDRGYSPFSFLNLVFINEALVPPESIHEYLADQCVLQNGISPSLYQQMILNETMGIQQSAGCPACASGSVVLNDSQFVQRI